MTDLLNDPVMRPPPICHQHLAFSLIEVALAVGIVATGLLSTLGIMAVGLSSFQTATNRNIQAQITQRIFGDLKQTDFSRLSQMNGAAYYFDDQGLAVTDTSNISAKRYAYSTRLTITNASPVTGLPGSSSTSLATARVEITSTSTPGTPFVFTTVISDNGS
jgi:uncharacterized protein (TIGR02598 family)